MHLKAYALHLSFAMPMTSSRQDRLRQPVLKDLQKATFSSKRTTVEHYFLTNVCITYFAVSLQQKVCESLDFVANATYTSRLAAAAIALKCQERV